MTILSGKTLRRLRPVGPFLEPFKVNGMTAGVSHCGYDIRIKQDVSLFPGDFKLASSIEEFNMPRDVMGEVKDKSTWARRGLSVFNTVIEPGWRGFLTLELVNNGRDLIRIRRGDPIAQVVFSWMDEAVEGYDGKYQDQPDMPVAAKFE